MVASPHFFAAQHLVCEQPPVPVSATYDPILEVAEITFDAPLVPGPINELNWAIVIGGLRYQAIAGAVAIGNTVTFTKDMIGMPDPAIPCISYAAAPPDVTGLDLARVAPFAIGYV